MIRFIEPLALLALLILPLLWALALLGRHRALLRLGGVWRFWGGLLLRSILLIALALALAGAQLVLPRERLTVIFLLDRSDSLSSAQHERAEAYVRRALAALPAGDRAGLVLFGQQALIERAPAAERRLGALGALPGGARTNIEAAIQLALALLPAEGQRRIVLLSDGGANEGDARHAARVAAGRGVALEVLPLVAVAPGADASIGSLVLPPAAREGQRLSLAVDVGATFSTTARLAVYNNGAPALEQQLELAPGSRRLELALPPPTTAFNRYEVRLEAPGDTRPQNNSAQTFTYVSGPPAVLLIEGRPGAARNLSEALGAAGFQVQPVEPAAAPADLAALSAYDAVLLVEVPLDALPSATAAALPLYVRDLGRGLAMVGGENSFGAGGYHNSAIETAMPVWMYPPPQVEAPPVSIVVVIDISGSMSTWRDGVAKAQLAADGAAQIAAQLRDDDELTVIPFDSISRGAIGPLPGSRSDEAIRQLRRISPGAKGITMYDAIQDAAGYLRGTRRPVRHLITVVDGDDAEQQEGGRELVSRLRAEGITLTSIAVGDGKDVSFLRDLAALGGGRFFFTENARALPRFLDDEAKLVMRPYLIEGAFTPEAGGGGADAAMLDGVVPLPSLYGYVSSSPKQRAQVLLRTPQGDPLLAVWRYGLGRSLAWTSDFKGKWGRDLVQWRQFPQLAAQLAGWLLPPPGDGRLSVSATVSGEQLLISASAQDDAGRPARDLHVSARLLGPDNSVLPAPLRESAPGSYRALVAGLAPGAYMLQLSAADAAGQPFAALTTGASVPGSAEHGGRAADRRLLEELARIAGGRVDPPPEAVYENTPAGGGAVRDLELPLLALALLLLPLDVALRRVRVGGRIGSD
jgi:uncharacterized membrane protein